MERINHKVELDNYHFSGLEASQIGALLSVLKYYKEPTSASWIYGMTGMAFLLVHDHEFKQPNAGPPDSQIFMLARNIGLDIEGVHTYAEQDQFRALQQDMWHHAYTAIDQGYPVFAKNLDIENQTSLVYGVDAEGYYTHSWHGGEGHENWDDVIPWDRLGLSYCPCRYCRSRSEPLNPIASVPRLISLHWAKIIPAIEPLDALREALQFVIALNQQGVMYWHHHTYVVGEQAYIGWMKALEHNKIEKYYFSLTIEAIADARRNAVHFFNELKDLGLGVSSDLIDEAMEKYTKIAAHYTHLVHKYPYEQPRELLDDMDRQACIEILQKLMQDEKQALGILVKLLEQIETMG